MFTWDRTSVLGWRTDRRGGLSDLGLHPQQLVTAFLYDQDMNLLCGFSRCVFVKSTYVAKHVFQPSLQERLFALRVHLSHPSIW